MLKAIRETLAGIFFWLGDLIGGNNKKHAAWEWDIEMSDVAEFFDKFGFERFKLPRLPVRGAIDDRIKLMKEELAEFVEGAEQYDLVKMADALIDLVYVTKGTAVKMGLPWVELWDDVHDANMRKERGVKPGRELATGDVIKPEGWVGPQTRLILMEAGWRGQQVDLAGIYRDPDVPLAEQRRAIRKAVDTVEPVGASND